MPADIAFEHLLRLLPADRGIAILDAGCGAGRYAEALVRRGYRNLIGVDRTRSAELVRPSFPFVRADVRQLPFRDASFDFVYATSVIYFAPDPAQVVAEFKRVLRRGGSLYLTGHTRHSLFTLQRVVLRALGHASVEHLRHVRFRSTNYYQHALESNGFRVTFRDGYRVFPGSVRLGSFLRDVGIAFPSSVAPMVGRLRSHIAYHFVLAARRT